MNGSTRCVTRVHHMPGSARVCLSLAALLASSRVSLYYMFNSFQSMTARRTAGVDIGCFLASADAAFQCQCPRFCRPVPNQPGCPRQSLCAEAQSIQTAYVSVAVDHRSCSRLLHIRKHIAASPHLQVTVICVNFVLSFSRQNIPEVLI